MDFSERLIEINMQLADGLSKLHALNTFAAKKIFIKVAKKILILANENKQDKKVYEKFMDLFVFAISSSGIDKKELEKMVGGIFPYKYTLRIIFSDSFGVKSKDQSRIYSNFYEELDAIFESSPFVSNDVTIKRIEKLYYKYNMPSPLSCITALHKV